MRRILMLQCEKNLESILKRRFCRTQLNQILIESKKVFFVVQGFDDGSIVSHNPVILGSNPSNDETLC